MTISIYMMVFAWVNSFFVLGICGLKQVIHTCAVTYHFIKSGIENL